MAVISMISIGEGAKEKALQDIESLGIRNIYINNVKLSEEQKSKTYLQHISGLSWSDVKRVGFKKDLVRSVAATREVSTEIQIPKETVTPKVIQVSSNYFHLVGATLSDGRFLLPIDKQNSKLVCVLGATLANKLGRDGQVGKTLLIGESLHRVVGILAQQTALSNDTSKVSPDDLNETLFLPFTSSYGTVGDRQKHSGYELSRIIVEAQDSVRVDVVAQFVRKVLSVTHKGVGDYQVVVPQELLKQSIRTKRLFNIVLATIGGVSLFVGGIGIMNIMLANVSERRREIGIRRSVGARKKDIIFQFLAESVILTISGGLIGILLGVITTLFVEGITGWPMVITAGGLFIPFCIALAIGIFFGLYPAMKASEVDPISALNSV